MIKDFIGGMFLGMADGELEDCNNPLRAKKYLANAKNFVHDAYSKSAYCLVSAKISHKLGDFVEAKENYYLLRKLIDDNPKFMENREFKTSVQSLDSLLGKES